MFSYDLQLDFVANCIINDMDHGVLVSFCARLIVGALYVESKHVVPNRIKK